jgi:hypothetical protein
MGRAKPETHAYWENWFGDDPLRYGFFLVYRSCSIEEIFDEAQTAYGTFDLCQPVGNGDRSMAARTGYRDGEVNHDPSGS